MHYWPIVLCVCEDFALQSDKRMSSENLREIEKMCNMMPSRAETGKEDAVAVLSEELLNTASWLEIDDGHRTQLHYCFNSGGRNSSLVVFGLAVLRNAVLRVRSSSGEIFG